VPARRTAPLSENDESRTRARHRSWGFAALSIRLPTLFRRLAPERRWLDRGRYRALFTLGRSWPRAARRLLQSKRSASTTCGPRNPVTPIGRSTCAELLILRDRSSSRLGHRRFYTTKIQSKGSRGFTGQGPWIALQSIDCSAGLLRDDRSSWRLRPNPIGSNTSCRATRVDYDRSTVIERRARLRNLPNEFEGFAPGDTACALASEEGRLPHPFAKRRCVPLHPRCFP